MMANIARQPWKQVEGLAAIMAAKDAPIVCRMQQTEFDVLTDVALKVGDKIVFRAGYAVGRGTVLEIDHGANFPIRLDWVTPSGHHRVTSFHPGEFNQLVKE